MPTELYILAIPLLLLFILHTRHTTLSGNIFISFLGFHYLQKLPFAFDALSTPFPEALLAPALPLLPFNSLALSTDLQPPPLP